MLRLKTRRYERAATGQLGLSVVELMVGIAVGLFVVAAATMLVSTQLSHNRRLLLETQVQQDLRATADIITRGLRRAGHWDRAEQFVWIDGGVPVDNPHDGPDFPAPDWVDFDYSPPSGSGPYGFRRQGNVLQTRLGSGGWQELTDGNSLRITSLSITPQDRVTPGVPVPCPNLCPDGSSDCWPTRTLTVRELVVDIQGEAAADPAVKRSLRSVVRLRNDLVSADPSALCPA